MPEDDLAPNAQIMYIFCDPDKGKFILTGLHGIDSVNETYPEYSLAYACYPEMLSEYLLNATPNEIEKLKEEYRDNAKSNKRDVGFKLPEEPENQGAFRDPEIGEKQDRSRQEGEK